MNLYCPPQLTILQKLMEEQLNGNFLEKYISNEKQSVFVLYYFNKLNLIKRGDSEDKRDDKGYRITCFTLLIGARQYTWVNIK